MKKSIGSFGAILGVLTLVSTQHSVQAAVLSGLRTSPLSSNPMRGTFARVKTTIPDANAQGSLAWNRSRNYYYMQVGGSSVGFQLGITEGKNWNVYFREFYYSKVNASTGTGEYKVINGTPGSGTSIEFQIEHVGGGNWVGRIPGNSQSPSINTAFTEFDRAGVYTKAEWARTSADNGSYKMFSEFWYTDIVKGAGQPAPNQFHESNYYSRADRTGNLTGKESFGLFANEPW